MAMDSAIVNLKEFLQKEECKKNDADDSRIILKKNRKYIIPDYQREIRWADENVRELIEAISHGDKYLGMITLAKASGKQYVIIDGQQRITVLYMILYYVRKTYDEQIAKLFQFCPLKNGSFTEFDRFLENDCDIQNLSDDEKLLITEADIYHQRKQLHDLWKTIAQAREFQSSYAAKQFINNLSKCEISLLLNDREDDSSIQCFLDINVKGIKLDTEDIFKGYLFQEDKKGTLKQYWKKIKCIFFKVNATKNCFKKLETLILQCLYCLLYKEEAYQNITFGQNLTLKKNVTIEDTLLPKGMHIIPAINNYSFLENFIKKVHSVLEVIDIIVNGGVDSEQYRKLFSEHAEIDSVEREIIYNFLNKIFCDTKYEMPKILGIKYVVEVLLDKNSKKSDYRKIYTVYMASTLYILYDGKKTSDELCEIVKWEDWNEQLKKRIAKYLSIKEYEFNILKAQNKYIVKEDEEAEDDKYRCKSLATIYNFFNVTWERDEISQIGIKKGKYDAAKQFLYNDSEFSVEHFIFNEKKISINEIRGGEFIYHHSDPEKGFEKSIFNFIFIERKMNNQVFTDHSIKWKINHLEEEKVKCEYSKMVYKIIKESEFIKKFPDTTSMEEEEARKELQQFYQRDALQQYLEIVRQILNQFQERLVEKK